MDFNIPPYEEIVNNCQRIWASGGVCGDIPTEPTYSDFAYAEKYINRNNWLKREVIALVPINLMHILSNCKYWKPLNKPLPYLGRIKNITFLLDDNLKRYTEKSKTFGKRYLYLIPMFLKTDKEIKTEDINVFCVSNFLECPTCFKME